MKHAGAIIAILLSLTTAPGCYGIPDDDGASDGASGTDGGGGSDARLDVDAGADDAAVGDGGLVDTGSHDAGHRDAGHTDAGVHADAGADAGSKDAGAKDAGGADGGAKPCDGVTCAANAHCDAAAGACACDPGFVEKAGACAPIDPGDPATRSKADMCAAWADGHRTEATYVWLPGPTECDPGTLEPAAIDDALRRINMFRWLVGLNSVTYDESLNAMNQKCAIMEYKMGYLSHQPDPSVPCYTQEGAQGAGSSNLALGTGNAADAIDLYINDGGVPSLGHRRWVLNPPFGPTGIGFAGAAQCLYAFGQGGGGSAPWVAWPNPGYTPVEATSPTWSWSSSGGGGSATAKVTRVGDGADMPVTVEVLPYGYGPDTMAIHRTNWSAQAGETYRVQISGSGTGGVTYDVKPVTCP